VCAAIEGSDVPERAFSVAVLDMSFSEKLIQNHMTEDSPIERFTFLLSDTVAKIFNAIGLHNLLGTIQIAYVICASDALKIKGKIITVGNEEGAVRLGATGKLSAKPESLNRLYDDVNTIIHTKKVMLFAERIEHEGNHVLARRLPFNCFPGDYCSQSKAFTEKRFGVT